MATTTTERYEFQPPTNINAIRSSIMQRIKQRSRSNSVTSSPSPLTPPHCNDYDKKLPYLHLDNGLPSPPIESCSFEECVQEEKEKLPTEVVVNALMELSEDLPHPPSPILSLSKTEQEPSPEAIRKKIRLLKEEKHKLFQVMKDLLSKPASPVTMDKSMVTKERARSSSRDKSRTITSNTTMARPRSISHTDFAPSGRPRYYERRSPPPSRFYNNNSYYPYNRNSYPTPPSSASSSSSSSSLNMSRRVVNNNCNSSYVTSRPQLAVRPSSSSSTTFRLPSRPERY